MKIFTKLLICFLPFFSASLWAKPLVPAFSEPADTLLLSEELKTENNIQPSNTEPDSMAVSVKPADSDVIVNDDWCGTGVGTIDLIPDPAINCPCNYLWSNGAGTQDLTGLTTGQYNVTIFDANGGWSVAVAFVGNINNPPTVAGVATGNTLCNGTSNGAIDLTVTGVFFGYDVEWSNGATSEDLSGLDPGTYTVTVTVGVTCSAVETFVVQNLTNAPAITFPAFGTDYCETSNGTASVFPMGGIQPYTYEWTNGETTVLITDLAAGDYTITVTGADGCSTTYTGTVNPGNL
ncbi:MAG: SprB repeat-containing protein [Lewinellaceae bacterium]|nr:SprB repeat-containing protein [Lewinellaceae bacterium]